MTRDPCTPLCIILPPFYPPSTHTTSDPMFGFCSPPGSRTAGPCSHGNRCSPHTWLDLALSRDGQASLTRVDGQLQRMRRHQLLPPSVPHLQNSCHLPSNAREGKDTSDSSVYPPHPPQHCFQAEHPSQDPGKQQSHSHPPRSGMPHAPCPCCFSPFPPASTDTSQRAFCCDGMTLQLLH